MSTYFATFPLSVPFPLLSEAFQTSVYWEPSLSVSVSVLNATSPAIAELRADSEALNEALRAEYEAMRDFFLETLEKFQGTDPEIDDYIARIYTTFLEQTVDEEVYGETIDWSSRAFTSLSPQYLLDEVEWFQHLPESKREEFITNSSHFNRGSSNYFYGLASAYNTALRRVISKRRSDWDLWREVPKLQEMYARIELLRDQMQVRNSLRGENSEEIRSLEEAMRVELSQALLDLMTARFSFDLTWEAYSPTNRYSNHMAYVETKITNPASADEIASQVELEVNNNRLAILTSLQDEFPEYEIPLEVPTRAYGQTGMVSNLNMSRNGRRSDYPVRDAITGNYLWVGGDEWYTGIRRYGGNGPAVDSLETFFEYVFPDTRLVSEYEDEYSLAGRGDEFDDYVDEYNRYQALATGQGELQEGDELFVTDGEFDLEAAINGLNDYYSYYGSLEAVQYLQSVETGLYTMPLEEVYEAVNRYDDAMEEYSGATPFTVAFESETFKTQQGESYRMDDASRPFFDPESEGPYELSESPSGSEVSYGAEHSDATIYMVRKDYVDDSHTDYLIGTADYIIEEMGPLIEEHLKANDMEVDYKNMRLQDWFPMIFGESDPYNPEYQYHSKGGLLLRLDGDGRYQIPIGKSKHSAEDKRNCGCGQDPCVTYGAESSDWAEMKQDADEGMLAVYFIPKTPQTHSEMASMIEEYFGITGSFPSQSHFHFITSDGYDIIPAMENDEGFDEPVFHIRKQDTERSWGAEPEMRRRVRTISGKPHTPRKLVKDQAITPEEAAKRVKLEAEGRDMYYTREEAMARARELGCHDVHTHEMEGRTVYMPCYTHERYENMLSKQAEDKKDDTVISTREESGITTETRQYKRKKYNPEKMKQDIPAEVLDQTDSDDLWVALAFGILGAGIAATVTNMAWIKRIRGD